MQLHDNAAFRRTGSEEDEVTQEGVKAAVKEAMAAASAEVGQAVMTDITSPGPKVVPSQIPTTLVGVEVYHMGQYTYRGVSEKVQLCQVFPASLSERRQSYGDIAFHGKAVCTKKDDSLALSLQVMLPDVLDLPLSAEPPLCINVVLPSSQSLGKQRVGTFLSS